MPLYEYECEKCGDQFEVMQKFSDEPLKIHEKCGGAVHRLLSAPALQFKGSGWYITDYAKGGGSSPTNGDTAKKGSSGSESSGSDSGSSKSAESSSSESKTESKPSSSATTTDKK